MTSEVVTYPIVLQKHMLTVYKKSYFPPSSSGTWQYIFICMLLTHYQKFYLFMQKLVIIFYSLNCWKHSLTSSETLEIHQWPEDKLVFNWKTDLLPMMILLSKLIKNAGWLSLMKSGHTSKITSSRPWALKAIGLLRPHNVCNVWLWLNCLEISGQIWCEF